MSVPSDDNADVAVIMPPVVVPTVSVEIFALVATKFVKKEETAERIDEKKFVEVPLTDEKLVVKKLEEVAEVITAEEAVREEI